MPNKDEDHDEKFAQLERKITELEKVAGDLELRVSRIEIGQNRLSQITDRLDRRVERMHAEWKEARAGMGVIWGRIKDVVSLSQDKLKVLERTVRQLARIINRLYSTDIVPMMDTGKLSTSARRGWLVTLSKKMTVAFSKEELIGLAFDARLDADEILRQTKTGMVRAILLHFFRNDDMDILLTVLARERPKIVWPLSPLDIQLDFDPDEAWREFQDEE